MMYLYTVFYRLGSFVSGIKLGSPFWLPAVARDAGGAAPATPVLQHR